ncbi:MAG: hypothetical protein JWN14_5072 [Chthonomonadales bacterium]|nr:hypothetical protein [Chthonomonadales bacterium]
MITRSRRTPRCEKVDLITSNTPKKEKSGRTFHIEGFCCNKETTNRTLSMTATNLKCDTRTSFSARCYLQNHAYGIILPLNRQLIANESPIFLANRQPSNIESVEGSSLRERVVTSVQSLSVRRSHYGATPVILASRIAATSALIFSRSEIDRASTRSRRFVRRSLR